MRRLSILFILVFPASLWAETFTGKVVGVKDGDTIVVMRNGVGTTVRFHGVDCPEKRQDFGTVAKKFTSESAFGKTVQVEVKGKSYKRLVGVVSLDGKDLNAALLSAGMAWFDRKYSSNRSWAALELSARKRKVGLWSSPNPIPPWEFRHDKRK